MARELEMPRVEVTHPERKAGGANGRQTPPSRHWTRRSNPTDREGLSDLLGRAIPGWAAARKLSVLGAYRLWEDAYRVGDRRILVTDLSCSNQDRLRRASTQP